MVAMVLTALVAGGDPSTVGAAVSREVVHVAPGQQGRLDVGQAGALRLRIAERAIGRIKIAVVDEDDVREAGSISSYANAVDAALDPPLRGALLVLAPGDAHVVTSYEPPQLAVAAVQRAFASERGGEAGALRRAVDGLAAADPGRSADTSVPVAAPDISIPGFDAGGISDAVKVVLYAVAAAVLLPVLLGVAVVTTRARRRRRATAEEEAHVLADLRADLTRLGDGLVALEADDADPAYVAALDAYDRANGLLLGDEPSPSAVLRARAAVDDGLARLALARATP